MPSSLRLGAALLIAGLGSLTGASAAPAKPVPSRFILERVVLLQRHGVRSPTKAPADLNATSSQPWPAWPVAPGELTPHGATALVRMGEGLRRHYAALGLLPRDHCPAPGAVFVWSDSADHRTLQSGEAMMAGLASGCGLATAHGPPGASDPLFDAQAAGLCRIDAARARDELSPRLDAILNGQARAYAKARAALQSILTPDGGCHATKSCLIADGDNDVAAGQLNGPLAQGSTLSENILLEYAQGFAPADSGWGRAATPSALAAIMPLHNFYADVARRAPYLAARRASLLARTILDMLADGTPHLDAQTILPTDARLVVLVGHDTNLSNLSGLLDVSWDLPGQPDATAPDTALAFELWRDAGGRRYVALKIFYQTLDQLRSAAALGSVPSLALAPPGCAGTGAHGRLCALDDFAARLSARLAGDCLGAH